MPEESGQVIEMHGLSPFPTPFGKVLFQTSTPVTPGSPHIEGVHLPKRVKNLDKSRCHCGKSQFC